MDEPVFYAKPLRVDAADQPLVTRTFLVELLGYGVASAVALAADLAVLKALVDHVGWHYLPAATCSFIIGAGVAYVLSVRLAFGSRRLKSRTVEFGCFVALGVVGLVVNAASISVSVRVIGLSLVPAKLVAAVCTFSTNFALRRTLLFSPKAPLL